MARFVNPDVLDGALAVVASATRMVALSGEPPSYAIASSAKLAEATLLPADFALAAGDVSGRKVTVAAKTGVAVLAAGTADHIALLDPATSRLLYVTVCPAQAVATGGSVSFAAWTVEINNPA